MVGAPIDEQIGAPVQFLPMILLLTACVGLTAVARHKGWPAPLLVTGVALIVAGIPGIPELEIDSHVTSQNCAAN